MTTRPAKEGNVWVPIIIVILAINVGYALYLHASGTELAYQAKVLSPAWWKYLPRPILWLISVGGFPGTLTAVFTQTAHMAVICVAAYLITSVGLRALVTPRTQVRNQAPVAPGDWELQCTVEGSKTVVIVPENFDPITTEKTPAFIDDDPYDQTFVRCERTDVGLQASPDDPVQAMTIAVVELLQAHPDVPASCGAHHADATLKEHSLELARTVPEYMDRMGWAEPLAQLAGLAHDLDKLLAYKRSGDTWVKASKATHHHTYAAYLCAQQPEFRQLSAADQHVLTMALRYYHHPNLLPLDANERIQRLIQALRMCDGIGIRKEKKEGIERAQGHSQTAELLRDGLLKMLREANVNKHKGGDAASGWALPALDVVIMPMSTVLTELSPVLPADLSRQLQLTVENTRFDHPAIPLITATLTEMGLLHTSTDTVEAKSGLFDVRVGQVKFRACILLDKELLAGLMPSVVGAWGVAKFKVKILGETVDMTEPVAPATADHSHANGQAPQ